MFIDDKLHKSDSGENYAVVQYIRTGKVSVELIPFPPVLRETGKEFDTVLFRVLPGMDDKRTLL